MARDACTLPAPFAAQTGYCCALSMELPCLWRAGCPQQGLRAVRFAYQRKGASACKTLRSLGVREPGFDFDVLATF